MEADFFTTSGEGGPLTFRRRAYWYFEMLYHFPLSVDLQPEEVEAAAAAEAPPPEEKPKPVVREIQQPTKPIRKLVSRPRQKVPTPPPPKSPTPPPPPTPLPDFITQFVGTEWFEKYFPNCNETVSDCLLSLAA